MIVIWRMLLIAFVLVSPLRGVEVLGHLDPHSGSNNANPTNANPINANPINANPVDPDPRAVRMQMLELLDKARFQRLSKATVSKAYQSYVKAISLSDRGSVEEQDAALEVSQLLEAHHSSLSTNISSIEYLLKAADQGNAEAQHRLAAVYGTGIYTGVAPIDAGRALLLEQMSALAGHVEANMAMGYRYLHGIGVPESCELAKAHYEIAANVAINRIQRRGYELFVDRARLSEADTVQERSGKSMQSEQEAIDYLAKLTNEGDANAAGRLVETYVLGSRYCVQDLGRALNLMRLAANRGSATSSGQLGYLATKAMLERMRQIKRQQENERGSSNRREAYEDYYGDDYDNDLIVSNPFLAGLEFDDIEEDDEEQESFNGRLTSSGSISLKRPVFQKVLNLVNSSEALHLLHSATSRGDPYGQVGLGIVYYRGLFGTAVNVSRAMELLAKAVSKHPDASFYMGEIYMGQHIHAVNAPVKFNPTTASEFYSIAAQKRHLMAHYKLAHMAASGIGTAKICHVAVHGFKAIAERGDWMYSLTRAMRLYLAGQMQSALLIYSRLATVGVEVAQFNAGFILSKAYCPPINIQLLKYDNNNENYNNNINNNSNNNDNDNNNANNNKETAPPLYSNVGDNILISSRRLKLANPVKYVDSALSVSPPLAAYMNPSSTSSSSLDTSSVEAEGGYKKTMMGGSGSKLSPTHVSVSVSADPDLWEKLFFNSSSNTSLPPFALGEKSTEHCQKRSYGLLALSGHQGIADAWLLLGDVHYYDNAGLGTDKVMAVYYYQKAADLKQAHALFNLGIMYENGDGVDQDFHLAKRFFDEAAEYEPQKLSMPKILAVCILQWHATAIDYFGLEKTTAFLDWFLPLLMSSSRKMTEFLFSFFSFFLRATPNENGHYKEKGFSAINDKLQIILSRFSHIFLMLDSIFINVIAQHSPLSSYSLTTSENIAILALIVVIVYLRGYRIARRANRIVVAAAVNRRG